MEKIEPAKTSDPAELKAPLLPPILTGTSSYLWLWILPVSILLLLNLQAYWLIEGNMNDAERTNAYSLGLGNLVNLGIGLALYFAARSRKKKNERLSTFRIMPATIIQVAYLLYATASSLTILPSSVTVWIYPPSRFFYNQYAFCMLPLFWGIICIACSHVSFLSNSIRKNAGIAILAPVTLFLGLHALNLIGYNNFCYRFFFIIFAASIVLLGLLMFVALIRALMLTFKGLNYWNRRKQTIAIALIALVMPIGGLLLNRSIPFPVNFQAWEVYGLVVVNAAFLLWAVLKAKTTPCLSFYILCTSFPFTLYFFIVFLPYTPLSIIGCIALGAGFFVLTPTFLFTLHVYHLTQVRQIVHNQTKARGLFIGGLICFLLLPGFFTVRGVMDKSALNRALDFVYMPDIESSSIEYAGSRVNLKRALSSHRNYKNGIYYPLLSDYYSWLVFDNLVLPDDKIKQLERTFFDATGSTENLDPLNRRLSFRGIRNVRNRSSMPRTAPPSREVEIIGQDLRLFPADDQTTQATLTLRLENVSTENTWGGAEYINQLSISPGVFINGFRLHINGTPVPGRIFEKKTALWVYTMIRDSERRDPGILFYNNLEEVELRVFPINRGTPVTVEIDFLIPEKVQAIQAPKNLPDPAELIHKVYSDHAQLAMGDEFTYITSLDTASLPLVERENYLHLIIDRSQENGFTGTVKDAVQLAKEAFPQSQTSRITLANYNVIEANNDHTINRIPISGGFDLDKALAHSIAQYSAKVLDSAKDVPPPEPVFVIISESPIEKLPELKQTRIWQSRLNALQIYSVSHNNETKLLTSETKNVSPIIRIENAMRPAHKTRSLIFPNHTEGKVPHPEYYDPNSIEKWLPLEHNTHGIESPWTQAVALWVSNHKYASSPGSVTPSLKKLVAASRKSGVLLPATSYIVVENEAQWRMLENKEDHKIGQNKALDFLETPAPSGLILIFSFGAWLIWRKWQGARC